MIFKTSSKIIAAVLTAALALSPVFVTPISATDGQEVETDASSWRYQDGDIIEEGNVILPEDADESIVEDYNSQMGSSFEEQTEELPAEPVTDPEAEAVQAEEVTAETPAEAPADQQIAAQAETPAEEPVVAEAPAEEPIAAEAPADQQTAVQEEMPAQELEFAAAATGKYWKWSYDGKTIVSDGGTLKGIDVSYWQGTIDWAKVKKAGVDFAIIRCGFGSNAKDNDDTKFAANVRGCVKNGIPYGVYLYSHANTVSKANNEAEHALRLLRDNN